MEEKRSLEESAKKGRELINKEITEIRREKIKRRFLLLLILSPLSLLFNTLMGYIVYMRNPDIFTKNNVSDSLISIIATGEIPQITIMMSLFTIFILAYAYLLVKNQRMMYESTTWMFLLIGIIFNAWQIIGGLLWLFLING